MNRATTKDAKSNTSIMRAQPLRLKTINSVAKKLLLAAALIVANIAGSIAQTVITGDITADQNWTNDNVYVLSGWVYVKSPAVLTIEAGTVIKGEKITQGALIIERGAKLVAIGTPNQPIVFTSDQNPTARNYGDWGGIIICGNASTNHPGGTAVVEGGTGATFGGGLTPNDADNSGTLQYVRIEFPGIPFQPNQEINGLTLGAVGTGTTLENIQISYSGDDSYEWFGGTVNAKRLVAFRGWDDDFDTDNGFKGKLQYGVSLRDPAIADQSGSNSFETDNDATGTVATPQTRPVFSNFSTFGPKVDGTTSINSNFKRGAHLRRNTATNIFNSMISGFPIGLLIDATTTETNAISGLLQFRNNVIAGCPNPMDTIASSTWDIGAWFNTTGFNNTVLANNTDLMVADGYNLADPDFLPLSGSPLLSGADFTNTDLQDSYFEPTTFRGAFGDQNWTACWTEWDPQNEIYNGAVDYTPVIAINANGPTTFCNGGSVILTASAGASFLWSNGATTQSINVTTSDDYSVQVWSARGCTATSAPTTVTVNTPDATVTAGGPTTVCSPTTVTLTAASNSSYLWSNAATTQAITVSATGVFGVTVTDGNGCTATSTQTAVTVNAAPVANFVAQAFALLVNFTNTSTGNGNTYDWNFDDGSANVTTTNATHNYASDGSYDVVLAATNTCGTNSRTQTVNLSSEAITVTGNITTNTTWYNTNTYLLSGFVYVKDGATLTIQPGTLIRGEQSTKATLIIERGGKLIANGTVNQPIVFTSNQAAGQRTYGDWGGIILCGKATINLPGGEGVVEGGTGATFGGGNSPDDADNSGSLTYLRIEFPGIPFQPNQEINGLTMGGVGSGTTIENIQISYSGDDSYEWFGGSVNAKHLIAHRGWDDDFDTDNGFSGKLQFGISVRDASVADQSGSNGFESDNDATGTAAVPATRPIFSNFSIFGPLLDANTTINSNYKRSAHLRRNTQTCIYNSLTAGYPVGLLIDAATTEGNATNNLLQFRNNVLSAHTDPLAVAGSSIWDIDGWYATSGFNNTTLTDNNNLLVDYPTNDLTAPVLLPQSGSPLLSGADFTNANLQDAFFEDVTYKGAFGATDWTLCWANWDPQNTVYTGTIFLAGATADFSSSSNQFAATFDNASTDGDSYFWDFGVTGTNNDVSTDENPTYTYTASGTYEVTLIAYSPCGNDTIIQNVDITVGIEDHIPAIANVMAYPNPFTTETTIAVTLNEKTNMNVTVFNMEGKMVANLFNGKAMDGVHNLKFDATGQTAGLYFARIVTDKSTRTVKLLVR